MSETTGRDRLREWRRTFHSYPEPSWCEFLTTSRIVEACEDVGVDAIHVGADVLAGDERMGLPDEETLELWHRRAAEAGAREDVLAATEGGFTGAIAELDGGSGPTVALRVDIDALNREEATGDDHVPAREGFRSENEGVMHACGHDGHMAIGLGVLEALAGTDLPGTVKVLFQPAEELIGGGRAMAESGHLEDVDVLLAVHLGLDHPTGEVVAGVDGFLAVEHVEAAFSGAGAHAGGHPNEGRNALQAAATAVQNLYAIPRHGGGRTRVNVGILESGTATNIVPERADLEAEVRGETTALRDYMADHVDRMLAAAADMHDCTVETGRSGAAPSAESDERVRSVVADVAGDLAAVTEVMQRDELGGSEDATYLMESVQDRGGLAAYVGIGTDHPGGHHTATFDVDEESLAIGRDVLVGTIRRLQAEKV